MWQTVSKNRSAWGLWKLTLCWVVLDHACHCPVHVHPATSSEMVHDATDSTLQWNDCQKDIYPAWAGHVSKRPSLAEKHVYSRGCPAARTKPQQPQSQSFGQHVCRSPCVLDAAITLRHTNSFMVPWDVSVFKSLQCGCGGSVLYKWTACANLQLHLFNTFVVRKMWKSPWC